jgi:hypothetical protein
LGGVEAGILAGWPAGGGRSIERCDGWVERSRQPQEVSQPWTFGAYLALSGRRAVTRWVRVTERRPLAGASTGGQGDEYPSG